MQIPCGFLGVAAGRSTGMLASVSRTIRMSWRLAPSTASPTGTPEASVSSERLTPSLARSVGLGPHFFPRQWRFGHRAVQAQPAPVEAFQFIVLQEPGRPEFQEHAGLYPLLEPVVRRRGRTDARGIQGV